MDLGTRPRARNPLGGELLLLAGTKAIEASTRGKNGNATPEDARAGTGVDPNVAERPARQRQSTHQLVRSVAESRERKAGSRARNLHSTRTAPGAGCYRSQWPEEG